MRVYVAVRGMYEERIAVDSPLVVWNEADEESLAVPGGG